MKFANKFSALVLGLTLLSTINLPVLAYEGKPPKLFSSDTELAVVLSGPWRNVQRNAEKDNEYPIKLTYTGSDNQEHSFDATATARGITRRLRVCNFPPLKIHFDKKLTKPTEFRGEKSLKLVTYCQTNTKYEQYYIKEYLAYRIYNEITDLSFKVRAMMIEYADSEYKYKPLKRFSFMIEDVDDVAKRNGMEKLNIGEIPHRELDSLETSYYSLFQYMVGNLDWAATGGPNDDRCCHNSRLIGTGTDDVPKYVIPYDFDSTGLVNAHYAAPPDKLKVRSVRQRLYRGFCATNDTMPQAVERFQEKKSAILALFTNMPHMTNKNRSSSIRYINDFYEVLDDPKRFKREITDKCRG